jgi:hypothetical protein
VKNPENDPLGVELKSRMKLSDASFFSQEPSGSLLCCLCASTAPKEARIDLAKSCFDVSNCPCKYEGIAAKI